MQVCKVLFIILITLLAQYNVKAQKDSIDFKLITKIYVTSAALQNFQVGIELPMKHRLSMELTPGYHIRNFYVSSEGSYNNFYVPAKGCSFQSQLRHYTKGKRRKYMKIKTGQKPRIYIYKQKPPYTYPFGFYHGPAVKYEYSIYNNIKVFALNRDPSDQSKRIDAEVHDIFLHYLIGKSFEGRTFLTFEIYFGIGVHFKFAKEKLTDRTQLSPYPNNFYRDVDYNEVLPSYDLGLTIGFMARSKKKAITN